MTARETLEAQIAALTGAIQTGTDPCALAMARRYLSRAHAALRDVTGAPAGDRVWLGICGPNGWQPGIDDVVAQLSRPAVVVDERRAA